MERLGIVELARAAHARLRARMIAELACSCTRWVSLISISLRPARRHPRASGDLVEKRLDAIRSDRTAHELRLARILPQLAQEFEGVRSAAEIRACADAVLADYDDALVRSHAFTLVYRRTRACLRQDHCEALDAARLAISN